MSIYWRKEPQDRLWHFIDNMEDEVGGFGYARLDGNHIVVEQVWLVPQYVSKSEVDFIEGGGVAAAATRAANEGWLGRDDLVWLSWHSHNSMKSFWSGTDEECIKAYGGQGITRLLSIVGNHKHEYRQRLDFFGVEHAGIYIGQVTQDDLKLQHDPQDEAYENVVEHPWTTELKANLVEKPKPTYTNGMGYKQGQQWRNGKWEAASKPAPEKKPDGSDAMSHEDWTAHISLGSKVFNALVKMELNIWDITEQEHEAASDYALVTHKDNILNTLYEKHAEAADLADDELAEAAEEAAWKAFQGGDA